MFSLGLWFNIKGERLTQASGLPFNSGCRAVGHTLVAGPEGIYSLSGNTDDGAEISAAFATCRSDFGIKNTKRIRKLFFGMQTGGNLTVRIVADENSERTFIVTAPSTINRQGGTKLTVREMCVEDISRCTLPMCSV
jgi:hypothetical protein